MTVSPILDLPASDALASNWPWTADQTVLPGKSPAVRKWPRISVITPSLNQGEFLERTVRSVLLQYYPELEYIIIDGGSTDNSVEIIEKYADSLAYYVSEPDRGYIHAINKGLNRVTGEIVCWLSSDDSYLPGTLETVARNLAAETGHSAIVGHVMKVYTDGRPSQKIIGQYSTLDRLLKFWLGYQMHQPSIFWRREVFESIGYLSEERDLIADFDYWVRIARQYRFHTVDRVLSCATHHPRAKTSDNCRGYHEELRRQAKNYWGSPFKPNYWFLEASMFKALTLRPRLESAFCRCKTYRVFKPLLRRLRPTTNQDD
ncbi:MAG: glycosyltransferase family 2 protein [Acidobacteriota bacterium]